MNKKLDLIKSPFNKDEKSFLKSVSSITKEENTLSSFQRKILYEAGHFNEIFSTRFRFITDALHDFEEYIEHDKELYDISEKIINKSILVDLNYKTKNGDPFFIQELSDAHRYGLYGLKEDEKKAFDLTLKASKKKYPVALTSLGDCYKEGIGTLVNHKKAIEAYQKAVDLGFNDAMTELSDYYIYGHEIEKNIDHAIKLLKQSLKKTAFWINKKSYGKLGWCYLKEYPTNSKNLKQGIRYLNLGKKAEDSFSIYLLAECYLNGSGVSQNDKTAFKLFSESYKLGHLESCFELAMCHYDGIGTKKDYEKAFKLFMELDNENHFNAQFYLGYMYFHGLGVKEDDKKAYYYFKKSNQKENPWTNFWLGRCYYRGYGVKQNKNKGIKFLEKSSDDNYLSAKEFLSKVYLENKNYKLAEKILKEAIVQGSSDCKLGLAQFYFYEEYENENNELAYKWFVEANKDDIIDASYFLGECFAYGYGVDENSVKALKYLNKYIKNVDEEAIYLEDAKETIDYLSNEQPEEKLKIIKSNVIDFPLNKTNNLIIEKSNIDINQPIEKSKKTLTKDENLAPRIPDCENFLLNLEIDDFSEKMIKKYFQLKTDTFTDNDEFSHMVMSLFKACEQELVNFLKLTNYANTFDEKNKTDINHLIHRLKDWINDNIDKLNLPIKWKKNIRDFGKLLRIRNNSAHLNVVPLEDLLPAEKITKKLFLQLEEMKIFIKKK